MVQRPKLSAIDQLREDIDTGFFGTISIIRTVRWLLPLWLLAGILTSVLGHADAPGVGTVIGIPLVVMAGYALAGFTFGIVLFIARPLRRFFVGWLISGYLLGASVYGSIGLVSVVAYTWLGLNIMDYTSPTEAWAFLPTATGLLGLMGLVAGGAVYFHPVFGRER